MPFEKPPRPPIAKVLKELGIECDAPPHEVVEACRIDLRFFQPADVRWNLVSPGAAAIRCRHRASFPPVDVPLQLQTYQASNGIYRIRIGQCPTCHHIYWRAALANEKDAA